MKHAVLWVHCVAFALMIGRDNNGRAMSPDSLISAIDNSDEGFTQFLIDEFEDSMNAQLFDIKEVVINAVY